MFLLPSGARAQSATTESSNVRSGYGVQKKMDNRYTDDKRIVGDSLKTPPKYEGEKFEKKRDMMKNILSGLVKRIEAGVSRLEGIITRLESRNAKLESEGIKTAISADLIAQAKVELAGVKSDMASLPQIFNRVKEEPVSVATASISADTRLVVEKNKTNMTSIRDVLKSAKNHLVTAQGYLIKAVHATKTATPQTNVDIKN